MIDLARALIKELIDIQILRWKLVTAFDVVTEALLNLMAIVIVVPVQLKLQFKFQVVLAFFFRLPYVLESAY